MKEGRDVAKYFNSKGVVFERTEDGDGFVYVQGKKLTPFPTPPPRLCMHPASCVWCGPLEGVHNVLAITRPTLLCASTPSQGSFVLTSSLGAVALDLLYVPLACVLGVAVRACHVQTTAPEEVVPGEAVEEPRCRVRVLRLCSAESGPCGATQCQGSAGAPLVQAGVRVRALRAAQPAIGRATCEGRGATCEGRGAACEV
jgi:hypothetical protein